jgi:hypothetical protein
VTGHLEALFGPAHQDIEVRCYGGICRLRGPGEEGRFVPRRPPIVPSPRPDISI